MFRPGLFFCQVSIVVSSIEDDLASNASERRLSTKTSDTKLPSITGGNICFFVNSFILRNVLHPGVHFMKVKCHFWDLTAKFDISNTSFFWHLKHHLNDILKVNFGCINTTFIGYPFIHLNAKTNIMKLEKVNAGVWH